MAGFPAFKAVHVVAPDGATATPEMASLCRSVSLVNAVAYFLESLQPVPGLAEHDQDPFIRMQIAGLAMNVHTITGADAGQARTDVELLAKALRIEMVTISATKTEGTVH